MARSWRLGNILKQARKNNCLENRGRQMATNEGPGRGGGEGGDQDWTAERWRAAWNSVTLWPEGVHQMEDSEGGRRHEYYNLGIRWEPLAFIKKLKWKISFLGTSRTSPRFTSLQAPLEVTHRQITAAREAGASLDAVAKEKYLPCWETHPDRPARRQIIWLTKLSSLTEYKCSRRRFSCSAVSV
jgi:hypothetical protein